MSQIDEMINKTLLKLYKSEDPHWDTNHILYMKAFASEVCKAMLEDCLPVTPWSIEESNLVNMIKERAEKWVK